MTARLFALLVTLGLLISTSGCPIGLRAPDAIPDDDDDASGSDDDDTAADDDDTTSGDDDDTTAGDDDDSTAAPLALGDLIITEVLVNPGAVDDTAGEWIEVLNLTSAPVDLSGWVLSDRDTDSVILSPAAALVVNPGDYVVLGRSSVPATNGGAPVDWAYGTAFTLANAEDEIVLTTPGGLEIHALEYTSAFPNPSGIATQLSGAALTYPASLDLLGNWCSASAAGAGTFGMGDTGTPGQTNPTCS